MSTFGDRCEIRLLYLLKIYLSKYSSLNIFDTIAVCELCGGLALQCFHYYCEMLSMRTWHVLFYLARCFLVLGFIYCAAATVLVVPGHNQTNHIHIRYCPFNLIRVRRSSWGRRVERCNEAGRAVTYEYD